jgi:hypothetical protein
MCLVWAGIGFFVGWIVFKRPEWATRLLEKMTGKLPWSS